MTNTTQHITLTETQAKVSELNAIAETGRAFDAFSAGNEKLAGIHARAAFRYARQSVYGIAYSQSAREWIEAEIMTPYHHTDPRNSCYKS